jgi:hypothetical protein
MAPCLHSKPLDLHPRDLMFAFVHAQEDFFSLDPCSPYTTTPSPRLRFSSTRLHLYCFAYTLIGGLTDMGTHGSPPARVLEVPAKWTRRARSPIDLQVGPETLSTNPATSDILIQIADDLPVLRGKTFLRSWRCRRQ